MKPAVAVALCSFVFSGCYCGLDSVRDCGWEQCIEPLMVFDGGRSASTDAGISRSDAGPSMATGVDAGGSHQEASDSGLAPGADGGAAGADAGWVWGDAFETCFPGGVHSEQDIISVHGRVGHLEVVHYSMRGYSAGASGTSGIQRFTNAAYGTTGLPDQASFFYWDTGLWAWTDSAPVVLAATYSGKNDEQYNSVEPFINFRIFTSGPSVYCPAGSGLGRFMFLRFGDVTKERPVEGMYEFTCADAGIDVRGCFHYE